MGSTKQRSRRFISLLRLFGRNDEGATAVEFAIVVIPFIALMFTLIETALVFFTEQSLETAVQNSARLILTGQVQAGAYGGSMDEKLKRFKEDVCAQGPFVLVSAEECRARAAIDVRTVAGFAGADTSLPINDRGEVDTRDFTFSPGQAGDIVVVRVALEVRIFVPLLNPGLGNLANGNRLIMSSAAFRNEPFPQPQASGA
ncbi:Flp pilus assembly protein TadG [Chelatococcus sambhunathii]|uniref:Flp pilus assembly protein TadG n=1 Tax=Chelatococcus sambhunathii TaxID=363953 RepID=A0ABP2A6E8_9HYPH|nr:TadE/TadG family type IV pilus assembly protein [Chelatococcus sambhunathii]CUA89445.1 Flp pilus assembly protein TadG [Chelatococcus sambhunathii]